MTDVVLGSVALPRVRVTAPPGEGRALIVEARSEGGEVVEVPVPWDELPVGEWVELLAERKDGGWTVAWERV